MYFLTQLLLYAQIAIVVSIEFRESKPAGLLHVQAAALPNLLHITFQSRL